MLLLIDNYDSFTYNLVHYLGELGAEVDGACATTRSTCRRRWRCDPRRILLSPGPCDPDQAGICLALIAAAAETGMPLLGVCLGHQAIGQAFGGQVVRARRDHARQDRRHPPRRRRACSPACPRRSTPRATTP